MENYLTTHIAKDGMNEPQEMILMGVIDKIDGLVTAYKEYSMVKAVEETKRIAYREEAKVRIKELEEETKRYISRNTGNKEVAFRLIDTLNNVIQNKDLSDDSTYKTCELLMNNVVEMMK